MATLPSSNGHQRVTLAGVTDSLDVLAAPTATSTPSDIAIYMRVSGEEQKRQGTIENQRTAIDRYLRAYDITPYGSYEDEAVSGHFVPFGQRPEGARVLADARAGHVKTVLVWKLDRFGRNAREILNAVHELEKAGALLVSLKEQFDTRTPFGRLALTLLAALAEYEWEGIMERTAGGMERRLVETAWMGGKPPIGYRVEGKKERARLALADTPDPTSGYSEADVVKQAWHLLVERDMPCDDIADYLTDDLHIPARSGGRWAPTTIHQMLKDSIYTGTRTYTAKDGTMHSHPVPQILTDEQYQRAQTVLCNHRRFSQRSADHDYLLRDLIRCAECGERYTTSWCQTDFGNGPRSRYYACSTRRYHQRNLRRNRTNGRPTDCHAPSVDAVKLEAEVWADVERFIREPGETLTLLAAQQGVQADQATTHRERLAHVQQQHDGQQRERDSVVALFRKGTIDERDLDRQLADIKQEEAGYLHDRDQLLAAQQSAADAQQRLQTARDKLLKLRALLDSNALTPALQREAVEGLVASIRIETHPDGLSRRGQPKYRPNVVVTYYFDERHICSDHVAARRCVSRRATDGRSQWQST
jgi:site-specific DNA recombinase